MLRPPQPSAIAPRLPNAALVFDAQDERRNGDGDGGDGDGDGGDDDDDDDG